MELPMNKKANWPLKGPFTLEEQIVSWETATKQRVELIAEFFGGPWPQSETDWLALIFEICKYHKVPGFRIQLKSAGADEKWSAAEKQMLFDDVMSVVVKQRRRSEFAAVKYIVENPVKFPKYSNYKVETLHRRFVSVKRERNQGPDPTDL
jgi:hypothetical protein